MKQRISHWPSTVFGLGVLALVAYFVSLDKSLLSQPVTLLTVVGGLLAIIHKSE